MVTVNVSSVWLKQRGYGGVLVASMFCLYVCKFVFCCLLYGVCFFVFLFFWCLVFVWCLFLFCLGVWVFVVVVVGTVYYWGRCVFFGMSGEGWFDRGGVLRIGVVGW